MAEPCSSSAAPSLLGLTRAELDTLARDRIGRGHGRSGECYRQVFRAGRFEPEALGLGPAACAAWRAAVALRVPAVRRVIEEPFASPAPGASTAKAILGLDDGREIEMVRIPMGRGRHTLCISSQVGCKRGCTFCETGRMGLVRDLGADEIVAQLWVARHVLGWDIRNLVFMGMGEAMDNWDGMLQALAVLTDRSGFGLSQERITVCTVGNADGIRRLAASGYRRVGLSLSLNAATDERRRELMPIARVTPLAEVQAALQAYRPRHNFAFGINYCLMPGRNDHPGTEYEIADFIAPLGRCLVNVIPYNPGTVPICESPSETAVDAFCHRLRAAGCPVRKRITKGRSVMAACGQLGRARRRPVS